MAALNWCFTLNNYDETELDTLRTSLSNEQKVRYAVFGKEKGEGGTPHLQGFVSLKKLSRLKAAKAVVSDRAHLEICKGSPEQNFKYCTKDGEFEEFGNRKAPGKRNDLTSFQDAVKSGILDRKRLREEYPEVCAKYPRYVQDYVQDNIPKQLVKCFPLHDWQSELNKRLLRAPDDRKIIFVIDSIGNKGKTWFAKYYCQLHDNAVLMVPTKRNDMAYLLPDQFRVLFLDCTRRQVESLDYPFLEQVKNGCVVSPKYESRMRMYPPVHLVVLMNESPDPNALSDDRYEYINLN